MSCVGVTEGISSELIMWGGGVRRCLETILCIYMAHVCFYV